jgi:hypothetical protein
MTVVVNDKEEKAVFLSKEFLRAEVFRYKLRIKRNPLVSHVASWNLLRELRYKPTMCEPTVTWKMLFFFYPEYVCSRFLRNTCTALHSP